MNTKLTEMIDSLVLEKTVTLDAINSINELKRQAGLLESQLKAADEREAFHKLRIEDLIKELRQANDSIVGLEREAVGLSKGLDEMRQKELKGVEAVAELKGFTSAMQMVFKPSAVRETFHKIVPVGVPGGNGCSGWVSKEQETGTVERSAE